MCVRLTSFFAGACVVPAEGVHQRTPTLQPAPPSSLELPTSEDPSWSSALWDLDGLADFTAAVDDFDAYMGQQYPASGPAEPAGPVAAVPAASSAPPPAQTQPLCLPPEILQQLQSFLSRSENGRGRRRGRAPHIEPAKASPPRVAAPSAKGAAGVGGQRRTASPTAVPRHRR